LHLILRRVRQRAFVLEDLAEITAIDPAAAGWASDEMPGMHWAMSLFREPAASSAHSIYNRRKSRGGQEPWTGV
jgi:hypothetical protein